MLEQALRDAYIVCQDFGFVPERSSLTVYDAEQWKEFCDINRGMIIGANNPEGVYVPITNKAYIDASSPFYVSNSYHELFGHGLFWEHSRKQGTILGLDNIYAQEGFATWLEAHLCGATGREKFWEKKIEFLREINSQYLTLYTHFCQAEETIVQEGIFREMGFPNNYKVK